METGKIIIISVILIFILILFYLFTQVRKNLKSGVNRFDDENRLSRREHLPRFLFYILASSALGFFGNSMPESTFLGIVIFVIAIALLAFYFDIARKRLHDFNMSGYYSLFLIVPGLNIFILLGLFFIPGTKKENNLPE